MCILPGFCDPGIKNPMFNLLDCGLGKIFYFILVIKRFLHLFHRTLEREWLKQGTVAYWDL